MRRNGSRSEELRILNIKSVYNFLYAVSPLLPLFFCPVTTEGAASGEEQRLERKRELGLGRGEMSS